MFVESYLVRLKSDKITFFSATLWRQRHYFTKTLVVTIPVEVKM